MHLLPCYSPGGLKSLLSPCASAWLGHPPLTLCKESSSSRSAEPPSVWSPWCSRKEIIDALGHGFAALCREKLLLFGDKHHHLGHLVERCLGVGKAPGQEGVPCTEPHVLVLQGQERHHEINQVLPEELAVGITVLWSTAQERQT